MKYLKLQKKLITLKDEKYAIFQSKLGLENANIMGVRIPILRKIAKEISRENYQEYIEECKYIFFEETLIVGMIIGYINVEINKRLEMLDMYITKMDNWAITDSSISTYKFTKNSMIEMWNYIEKRLKIEYEYNLRFCIVMYKTYFLNDIYIDKVLENIIKIKSNKYYVQMANAWCLSEAYLKYPQKVEEIIKNRKLDEFTHNKTLQKIFDSLKIDKENKQKLKKYRI